MFARFLLFSGNWENEGNFYLLESENSIIILSAGGSSNVSDTFNEHWKIGLDYLRNNSHKLKAIIISNTNFKNYEFLEKLLFFIDTKIPIYVSEYSKIFFSHVFSEDIWKSMTIVENIDQELKIDVFNIRFFSINSWFIGNFSLLINFSEYSFYFFDSFIFNNISDNKFFSSNINVNFGELVNFSTSKKDNIYLVADCQNMHWQKRNSLFFIFQNFFSSFVEEEACVFIFYEFDLLHIFELFEIAHKKKEKIATFDKSFFNLLNLILKEKKDYLSDILVCLSEDEEFFLGKKDQYKMNYLLSVNTKNVEEKLANFLSRFDDDNLENFRFFVCIPPFAGGESKLARIVDLVFSKSKKIINLSKKEYLNLGVSFYDFKFLLNLIKPDKIITIQNSYKNSKFFRHFPLKRKFSMIGNGYGLDLFDGRKLQFNKTERKITTLDELLVEQRNRLGKSGLIIIFLLTEKNGDIFKLRGVRVENISAILHLKISNVEEKIKKWWESKIAVNLDFSKNTDNQKSFEKVVKRRLSYLLIDHFSTKLNIELEELLILIF